MLIILEGCDGTGKTTLAKSLQNIIGGEIIHCHSRTPNTYEFFHSIIEASYCKNIIADRFCYGQFVYQTEEERQQKGWLTKEELYKLEVEMLAAGAKVIHVVADPEEIEERLAYRNEEPMHPVKTILCRFSGLFYDSLLPIISWTTSRPVDAPKLKNIFVHNV